MSDIVERLREKRGVLDNRWPGPTDLELEAAAEITSLRARLAERQAVIDWISTWVNQPVGNFSVYALDGLFGMTRDRIAALSSDKAGAV